MSFIDKTIESIKNTKSDKEIEEILVDVYFSTQYDSSIRKEFDALYNK